MGRCLKRRQSNRCCNRRGTLSSVKRYEYHESMKCCTVYLCMQSTPVQKCSFSFFDLYREHNWSRVITARWDSAEGHRLRVMIAEIKYRYVDCPVKIWISGETIA